MARTVEIRMSSDLSGEPDAVTVAFTLDGHGYEIDVTESEKAELEAVLKPYIAASRVVSRRAGKKSGRGDGPEPAVVRAWAGSAGLEVPARGRIPLTVLEAYRAAH